MDEDRFSETELSVISVDEIEEDICDFTKDEYILSEAELCGKCHIVFVTRMC